MKQYLLSIYQPEGGTPPPEVLQKVMRDVGALIEEAKTAGAWVFNGGLHPPSTATVLRFREGEMLTTDGPFAEAKEHIGGFVIVKAARSRRGARVGAQAGARDYAADRGPPVPGRCELSDIERIFREQYGRAVAVLVRHFGDIDVAEEAVQDAFVDRRATVAVIRRAAEPGWLDHHDRPQPRDRPASQGSVARRSACPGRAAGDS